MLTVPETGQPNLSGYQRFSSTNIEITREESIERGPAAFFDRLATVAEELKAVERTIVHPSVDKTRGQPIWS